MRRWGPWVLAAAALLSAAAGRQAAMERHLAALVGVQLAQVARSGGLAETTRAFPVSVAVPEQAPRWVRRGIRRALGRSDVWGRAGAGRPPAGRIEVDVAGGPAVHAVRVALWRRGWAVAPPRPAIGGCLPLVALGAFVLSAATARSRPLLGLLVGGAAVQGLLAFLSSQAPAPGLGGADRMVASVVDGPAGRAVAAILEGGAWVVPGLAGLAVFAALLAWFDHLRSVTRGNAWPPSRVLRAVVATAGGGLLVEGALRAGLWALLATPAGAVAVACAAGALWAAGRAAKDAAAQEGASRDPGGRT